FAGLGLAVGAAGAAGARTTRAEVSAVTGAGRGGESLESAASNESGARTDPAAATAIAAAGTKRSKLDLMNLSLPPTNTYGRDRHPEQVPEQPYPVGGTGSSARCDVFARAALQEYAAERGAAASRATAVAARRDVQLALLRRDRVRLARIAKTLPGIAFVPRQGPAIGAARGPGSRHPVEVFVGKQRVGRVVASVAFDAALLRRLSRRSGLPSGDRLVFRRDLPTEVTIQGTRYHAAAARLQGGKDGLALVALAPSSRVEGGDYRNRVLIAGLVTLGCLFLLLWF